MKQQPGQGSERIIVPLLGLLFALVIAPCFFTTALRDIFVLPKAVPLAVGVSLIWLALAVSGVPIRQRRMVLAIKMLAASMIASACMSVDLPLSILGPHQQQFHALVPVALAILAYLGATCLEDLPATVFVFFAVLGGILVALPALVQITFGRFMAWTIQGGRAGSTFGSPIFLGAHLSMVLPLIFAWGRGHQRWVRVCVWTAFAVIALALCATKSRGAIAAAVGGILVCQSFFEQPTRRTFAKWAACIAATVTLCVLLRGHTGSNLGHVEIYEIALRAWRVHPVFGWGPDTFSLAFRQFLTPAYIASELGNDRIIQLSAHNDVLQVLATMGLVGLAAYAFLLIGVCRTVLGAVRCNDPEAPAIAGALAAVFIQAKFNPIPLTVIVIAAMLLGSLDRFQESADDETRYALPSLAALSSLSLLAVFFVMCKAERHQRVGEDLRQIGRTIESAQQFNLAAQVNPFDLWYTQRQLDYFWTIAPDMVTGGVNKMVLAAFSHNVSENIGRLHPNDPTAHELRALSYKFEGDMIGRDRLWEATHEIDTAVRLAPHFALYEQRLNALMGGR